MNIGTIEQFIDAYIEAALWSTMVDYGKSDLHEATLQRVKDDCIKFWNDNATLLQVASTRGDYLKASGYTVAERAGHDFWLTRAGHGAGFWDRHLGDVGTLLSNAARAFPTVDLYVGDDGKLYL